MAHRIGIALQGGGAHGALTWGVPDRLLDEVKAGRTEIAAVSGTSAGALNAAALTLAFWIIRTAPAISSTHCGSELLIARN